LKISEHFFIIAILFNVLAGVHRHNRQGRGKGAIERGGAGPSHTQETSVGRSQVFGNLSLKELSHEMYWLYFWT
jgi:hypothetical protein